MGERELERRDVPLIDSRLSATPDGRKLVGYAAVFDQASEFYDPWEGGIIRETWQKGSFARSLANYGDRVKVLFNHGMDPSIGLKPLGKPDVMREDDYGLYVEVPLDRTSYNDDIIESLRSGALDGMSTQFEMKLDEWNRDTKDGIPERTVKEVALREFGPVTFPAFEQTLAGVRAKQEPVNTPTGEPGATPHADDPGATSSDEPVDTSAQERAAQLDEVAREVQAETEARALTLASLKGEITPDEDDEADDADEDATEGEDAPDDQKQEVTA